MGFFRQEYWSGLPFPSPGDLPDPGIEPVSCTEADSLPLSHLGSPISSKRQCLLNSDLNESHGRKGSFVINIFSPSIIFFSLYCKI